MSTFPILKSIQVSQWPTRETSKEYGGWNLTRWLYVAAGYLRNQQAKLYIRLLSG